MEKSSREAQRIYKASQNKKAPSWAVSHVCRVYSITLPCLFLPSFYIAKQSHIAFLGNSPLSPSASTPPSKLPRTRFLRLKQTQVSHRSLSIGSNMRSYRFLRVGLLQKFMVLVFLSLLVSGQKEEAMDVGTIGQSPSIQEKQQQKQQQQRLRHSLDVFLSSKRRVPNASDPLHNRWSWHVVLLLRKEEGESRKLRKGKMEQRGSTVESANNSLLVCAFCQMMVGCCGVLLLPRELHPCFQLLPVL